jgi:hypothetical protein
VVCFSETAVDYGLPFNSAGEIRQLEMHVCRRTESRLKKLGFDLIAEWQFRNRHGGKVERAIELDNVYGGCYLQGLLTKEGISSFVRSFHFRSLSFFFGPIVKMELMVPTVEFERTQEIIRLARLEIV